MNLKGNKHIYNINSICKSFPKIWAKQMQPVLLFFLLAFSTVSFGQVSTEVDTTTIRIGEQIQYHITVDAVEGVQFPKLQLDSLKKIEVVKSEIDSLKNRLIQKYALTSFDSGQYVLPSQTVIINNKKFLTDSVIIDVATVAVDTIKQPMYHIKDINNEPYTFDDFKKYVWWLLALLAIIGIILYFVYRKKPTPEEKIAKIPPFVLAKQRLKELDNRELWQHNKVKLYYVELTDIVRSFIEKELQIPALESTTDELMEIIADFNQSSDKLNIPEETLSKLKHLLKEADLVKFAKSKPVQHTIENHRAEAENIIDKLHPKEEEINLEKEDGQ